MSARPAGTAAAAVDLQVLAAVQQRVLWLATSMVHHANTVRHTPSGVKVGGHQASSASMASITDRRSIVAIADESRRLAASVRAGTATPAELTGATFTVSNLGMFGMTSIVPVINPPQAAILGVGAAREEVYLHDGQARVRHLANLTLSGDHRILSGADAARFLNDVKRLIESPLLTLSA